MSGVSPLLTSYVHLATAIVFEVVGTTFLQRSEQFTRLGPTVVMGMCYLASFYFLSLALRTLPIGIAYAIWSAVGIVLISLVGFLLFRQSLDLPAILGIAFIVIGVVIINVFSRSVTH